MHSGTELANADLFGTRTIGGQPEAVLDLPPGAERTGVEQDAVGLGTSKSDRGIPTPGNLELGREVSLASRLHVLMKDKNPDLSAAFPELEIYILPTPEVIADMESRHEAIRAKIELLSRIEAEGMDSGTVPPTPEACRTAIAAAESLFHARGILFSHVTALPDGGVELEADSPHLYIGLWVHGRDAIDVLIRRGEQESPFNARLDQLTESIWEQIG